MPPTLITANERGSDMVMTSPPTNHPTQMPQQQQPNPYQVPMPKFMDQTPRTQPGYEGGYMPQRVEVVEPGFAASMYSILWPTAGWILVLFNFATMAFVLFGTPSNYNSYAHGLASLISVATLAALAMIYKWILMAPDGLPRKQLPSLPTT